MPYFLALSLILTAFLALTASHLYGQYSEQKLLEETLSGARIMTENLARVITTDLDGADTPEALRMLPSETTERITRHLSELSLFAVFIYSEDGYAISSNQARWVASKTFDEFAFDEFLHRPEEPEPKKTVSKKPAKKKGTSRKKAAKKVAKKKTAKT